MRTLSTVEKAVDVLLVLAANQAGLGVTEIGARLAMKKSTAHQFLASLRKKELIDQDPVTRQYRLSPRLLRFGMAYLQHMDLPNRVLPFLRKLRDETGETVILNMRAGNTLIHVAQVEGTQPVRRVVDIGGFQPLQYGAPGKAVLAFLPEAEVAEILSQADNGLPLPFPGLTAGATPVNREELPQVRRDGYAVSCEQLIKGVHAMAAPVFNSFEEVFGCVTISGPGDRFTLPLMKSRLQPLLQAAQGISRAFGFSTEPGQPGERLVGRSRPGGRKHPAA